MCQYRIILLNIADEIEDTIIINNQRPKAYRWCSKNGSTTTTIVVENLKISDKYKKGGIISKKKYRKKVDIAISFRVDKEKNKNGEKNFGYLYSLLGKVKLPEINGEKDYKKNIRALNDNFNTIIKHYSKRAKKNSKKLYGLFDGIKLGGIHTSEGEIYLFQYVRFTNQNFGILSDICSAKIPSKPEVQHAGQIIDFLYCEAKILLKSDNISDSIFLLSLLIYIKVTINENLNILRKIEKEIESIKKFYNRSKENQNTRDFLMNAVQVMPSTPLKNFK
ncbi:4068_t:CDS:2 [Racocetra persica]|uniref:4068_t:CDS:1 n=1 Tax=Racocetra persica TaxID=160502 RepID=A0ACA9KRT3_9GLOM|nr:4068_t:CDS:2 [Racocetra persica]